MRVADERPPFGATPPGDPGMHRFPPALFDEVCAGPVTEATMAVLEKSQYSQRKLALRALVQQLNDHPAVVGTLVSPDHAWRILASAERQDPQAVEDILLYPTVGVWLTRALHHTRRDRFRGTPWAELGYLHLIAAAAATRCRIPCRVRIPVWHGVVTLPTVGQIRVPMSFPIGVAEVHCGDLGARIHAGDWHVPIDLRPDLPGSACTPVKWYVGVSRGHTLAAPIEDLDPYREFGAPQPPGALDQPDLAEWRKMLDEAWDVLTLWHTEYARELAAGLRAIVPIRSELGIVGASSSAAFGGILMSTTTSAIELAETLVHELQHSKINAVLGLLELTTDDDDHRYYAPWRDDPRPLPALLHGIYAFICGVEYLLVQRDLVREPEGRRVEYEFAFRRYQVRQTVNLLRHTGSLSEAGRRLVDAVGQRLLACERAPVSDAVSHLVEMIAADHHALWRRWFLRPDPAMVESMCTAWLEGASPSGDRDPVVVANRRALPAGRRNLLRTKALEPDLFARAGRRLTALAGSPSQADAALCLGDHQASAVSYRNRIRTNPHDLDAWVGLGLVLRAQGRTGPANALLKRPELAVATHNRLCARTGTIPDPAVFASWFATVR